MEGSQQAIKEWLEAKRAELESVFASRVQKLNNAYNKQLHMLRQQQYSARSGMLARAVRAMTQMHNAGVAAERQKFLAGIQSIESRAAVAMSEAEAVARSVQERGLAGARRALLIGINYTGTRHRLNGCIEDVDQINAFLKENGFNSNDIRIMTDNTGEKPTKDNILRAWREELNKAQSGDLLFFHYSGHGASTIDKSGDELDGTDEYLFALDQKPVLDDELNETVRNHLKEGVTLVALFDCCHSGTMLDMKYNFMVPNDLKGWYKQKDVQQFEITVVNGKVPECKGTVFALSGCMDPQTSAEAAIFGSNGMPAKVQGAMTYSFLKNMRMHKGSAPMTWRTMMQNIRSELIQNGYVQIPQISSSKEKCLDELIVL